MGNLTGDMTRLCGEIVALRGARAEFQQDLARGAASLQQTVTEMQTGFREARMEMARETQGERNAFLANLEKTVLDLRDDCASDLAGARRAWLGKKTGRRF